MAKAKRQRAQTAAEEAASRCWRRYSASAGHGNCSTRTVGGPGQLPQPAALHRCRAGYWAADSTRGEAERPGIQEEIGAGGWNPSRRRAAPAEALGVVKLGKVTTRRRTTGPARRGLGDRHLCAEEEGKMNRG